MKIDLFGESVPFVLKENQHIIDFGFLDELWIGKYSNYIVPWRAIPLQSHIASEAECKIVYASFGDFHNWETGKMDLSNPFCLHLLDFPGEQFAFYADYIHFHDLFANTGIFPSVIDWEAIFQPISEFKSEHSTFWVGTSSAYTPLHYDSYGVNIVAQIVGEKRWRLWKPTSYLASTDDKFFVKKRLPYEESSIYCENSNISSPNAPAPYLDVILKPGDILFIPKHWWHFVETISKSSVSINNWISMSSDGRDRLSEAITRLLAGCMVNLTLDLGLCSDDKLIDHGWINPSESDFLSGEFEDEISCGSDDFESSETNETINANGIENQVDFDDNSIGNENNATNNGINNENCCNDNRKNDFENKITSCSSSYDDNDDNDDNDENNDGRNSCNKYTRNSTDSNGIESSHYPKKFDFQTRNMKYLIDALEECVPRHGSSLSKEYILQAISKEMLNPDVIDRVVSRLLNEHDP